MLEVINLDFDFQDSPLLNNIGFKLPAGELLHLKGANGAGKSTLLKMIAGLYQPFNGQICFQGESIYSDLNTYQQQICYLGHKTGINPYLTIKENCIFDLHYKADCDLEKLVRLFNLESYWNQPCGLLSAGQKRQVGLLRLWMSEAKLWLLDEPLVALDKQALDVVMDKISEHRMLGGSVLFTSHQTFSLPGPKYQEYQL